MATAQGGLPWWGLDDDSRSDGLGFEAGPAVLPGDSATFLPAAAEAAPAPELKFKIGPPPPLPPPPPPPPPAATNNACFGSGSHSLLLTTRR